MEPRIVYEDGVIKRVCAEGALTTDYVVDGETVKNVEKVAVYE